MADDLMKRPNRNDGYVQRRAAEIYMPRVRRYLGADLFDEQEVMEQLIDVIRPNADGYDLAHTLDRRFGWRANESLVEVMSECVDDFDRALSELTAQWVRCLQIKPQFAIGDEVEMQRGFRGMSRGTVVQIHELEAKYGIRTAEQKETQCWVVPFEDVQGVLAAESVAA